MHRPAKDIDPAKRIAALEQELALLRGELLTPRVLMRLVAWLRSDPIKPAHFAFTAGIERQIAYALEVDIVPLIKEARDIVAARAHTQDRDV
ncbi:MAG: hypothetical protein ACM31O_03675 [Bacteroidota bacterium]